jgi:hypothetical protein
LPESAAAPKAASKALFRTLGLRNPAAGEVNAMQQQPIRAEKAA